LCEFFLPNSDHCFHKDVRAKLFVWSGLKWGKSLFNALSRHNNHKINDILKCSTSLENSRNYCADKREKTIYYTNTSEIPSELSQENFLSWHVKITVMLSSHMKRSLSLWLHNKSGLWKQADLIFHWCLYNKLLRSLVRMISSWPLEDKFISRRGHVISSM